MEDILKRIVEKKRMRIPEKVDPGAYAPRTGLFPEMMKKEGMSFVCEYKKASPSAGDIRTDLGPEDVAAQYTQAGARALSVLTEEDFFKGKLEYIARVRDTVGLPILRKDFILEEIQIEETRTSGADCILLITSILGKRLGQFVERALSAGLDVLVEVHNRQELETALDTGAGMIGINNRDLNTFEVSLETTRELAGLIKGDRIIISESGIKTREDIIFLESIRVDGVLIGESLMRSADIAGKLTELRGCG